MTDPLFDTAPGFDQPIAVLKHCHGKIRSQISTLQNLLAHLPQHGATIDTQQAARAVLQYFDKAAELHHEDEERDLMPMLQACASGEDAALLKKLVPEIEADHRQMALAWDAIKPQLEAIGAGSAAMLSAGSVNSFTEAYRAHMEKEEVELAPMALRLFGAGQMEQLGQAMQQRRVIGKPAAPAAPASLSSSELAAMRKDYCLTSLMEDEVLADPIAQFGKWFDEAVKAQVAEPNAMSMASVGADGKPTSRILLIKQFDERGFTFFTSYRSEKGQQLSVNPNAALLFYWRELERQVSIEGRVVKTSDAENDEYFYSRPLLSRLGAIASMQSAPVGSRAELDAQFEAVMASNNEQPQRPPHWGGYRLVPERIEFWQGRPSRYHDRLVFTRQADGSWKLQRLQP